MSARIQSGSARARLSRSIAACFVAWVSFSSAHADGAGESASATVTYSPQQASTRAGAQGLYKKLQAASRAVCRPYESRELARLALYNTCYQHALADAVAKVNIASLRNLHNERSAIRVASSTAVERPAS